MKRLTHNQSLSELLPGAQVEAKHVPHLQK